MKRPETILQEAAFAANARAKRAGEYARIVRDLATRRNTPAILFHADRAEERAEWAERDAAEAHADAQAALAFAISETLREIGNMRDQRIADHIEREFGIDADAIMDEFCQDGAYRKTTLEMILAAR